MMTRALTRPPVGFGGCILLTHGIPSVKFFTCFHDTGQLKVCISYPFLLKPATNAPCGPLLLHKYDRKFTRAPSSLSSFEMLVHNLHLCKSGGCKYHLPQAKSRQCLQTEVLWGCRQPRYKTWDSGHQQHHTAIALVGRIFAGCSDNPGGLHRDRVKMHRAGQCCAYTQLSLNASDMALPLCLVTNHVWTSPFPFRWTLFSRGVKRNSLLIHSWSYIV